jgi:pre-mRNA-processing factor 6
VNDLTAVGEGRGTVLSLKLDRMADSISGQTVVDPKGYLTGAHERRCMRDDARCMHEGCMMLNCAHTFH